MKPRITKEIQEISIKKKQAKTKAYQENHFPLSSDLSILHSPHSSPLSESPLHCSHPLECPLLDTNPSPLCPPHSPLSPTLPSPLFTLPHSPLSHFPVI